MVLNVTVFMVIWLNMSSAQLAGTLEYIDCISNPPHSWQSDSEAPVMLEVWGMWSTFSLPLLPDPLWCRVVAPDRILSNRTVWHLNWMQTNDFGEIELFDIEQFDHLTVCKQMTDV